jgi:hypothetical protein
MTHSERRAFFSTWPFVARKRLAASVCFLRSSACRATRSAATLAASRCCSSSRDARSGRRKRSTSKIQAVERRKDLPNSKSQHPAMHGGKQAARLQAVLRSSRQGEQCCREHL